ncbi:RNase H family protein [Sphingosinicella sp. BN140058]|uniref:RNase H family protein n=1 Tax=Sphingosinicella sp. BN140058 TaxID=1892855 RepID=UPI001010AD79|nr:RNase H family protein [Sphingosinicella sp. BN140058]QAY80487.1 hypothetical protein ETR14_28010 [Sphingosinicella sp. BN140058]
MPTIATDGSSLGTPMADGTRKAEGHGGWAAVIQFERDHPIAPGWSQELVGGKRLTTTGEVEVLGFLGALKAVQAYRRALATDPANAIITSACTFKLVLDSKYVIDTYREHLPRWIANDWRKSTPGKIKHQRLWQAIASLKSEIGHMITIDHQKGHTRRAGDGIVDANVEANDRADYAAGVVSRSIRDTGFIPQPQPIVWRAHASSAGDREADIEKLRLLAERILTIHGRDAAVTAFRLATFNTGVSE